MKKKFLSTLMALAMVLSLLPAGAWATEGGTVSDDTEEAIQTVSTADGLKTAVANGGKIQLTDNITANVVIPAGKTVTLDLNGHTLTNDTATTTNGYGQKSTIVNYGALTVIDSSSDGTGKVDNVTHAAAALYNGVNATAKLGGGTFDRSAENGQSASSNGGNSWYTICNHGDMTVNAGVTVTTANNSSEKGKYSSLFENGYQSTKVKNEAEGKVSGETKDLPTLTINGGTFDGGLNTIKNDDYATLTIKNGTFKNFVQACVQNHHDATIRGGTFTPSSKNGYAALNCGAGEGKCPVVEGDKHELTITGGTFNGEIYKDDGSITVTGGTFSADPSKFVDLDECYLSRSESGSYTVTRANSGHAAASVNLDGFSMSYFATVQAAVNAAAGSTSYVINMEGNSNEAITIPAGANITLDLNGKTLTANGTAILNKGTLTIKDSKDGGEVYSSKNVAVGAGDNSNTTIESGKFTGQEGAVITGYATGATITINGGKFIAIDNSVISGNGNKTVGSTNVVREKANTITINGGTFTGNIQTEGYIACGIYAPWKDIVTVNGGDFTVNNGIGVVIRAGEVTINGGSFTVNGSAKGQVGDKKFDMDAAQAVYFDDSLPAYPAYSGDSYAVITGGTFSVEPDSKYLAENHAAYKNDDNTWTVDATKYIVTFDAGNGTDVTPITVPYGSTIEKAPESTLEGWTLEGWYTDKECTNKFVFGKNGTPVTKNITLYANWTKTETPVVTYTVTFDTDGGSNVAAQTVKEGAYATRPDTNPTKSGYTFVNWYQDSAKTTVFDFAAYAINADTTVYAKWNANSSSGGSSSSGGGSSSGGSSSSGSTTTVTNKDGSTTTTVTNKDGRNTETTVTKPTTDAAGTTTTTTTVKATDKSGNTTTTTTEKATDAAGTTATVTTTETDKAVDVKAEVTVSPKAAADAKANDDAVTLPVEVTAADSSGEAAEVKITVPASAGSVDVEIPVENNSTGIVAVKVNADGTEEIIKLTKPTENGVQITLDGTTTVKLVDNSKAFDDVKSNDWFKDSVDFVSARVIMNGASSDNFAPNDQLNRAMMATVLWSLDNGPKMTVTDKFSDVKPTDWFANSVTWAAANGITAGYGDSFGAADSITREQMAVMLYGYAVNKGYDTAVSGDLSAFNDAGSTSAWATNALNWAVSHGLIGGKPGNLLDPTGTATRAEVATILRNFCTVVAD